MYEYAAQVVEVVDGDTVRMDVDLGFSIRQRMTLRLYGINTPEVVGTEKTAGLAAKEYLIGLLKGAAPVAQLPVIIKTFKDKGDKYGRLLALIFVGADPIPVNDKMVAAGHAKPYFGDGPKST
jgi:micrococcal nuclease